VNSIASETKELSEAGAISRAFLRAGGTELQQVIIHTYIVYTSIYSVKNSVIFRSSLYVFAVKFTSTRD